LIDRLNLLATTFTREFGLVGLNGIDYIFHNDQIYVLEVNPRYSASMELAEDAFGQSLFHWHVDGCRGLPLPDIPEYQHKEIFGKATVLAKKEGVLPDTTQWLEKGWHDVAYPGQPVFPRFPLCTVSARGRDPQDCYKKLVAEANELYRILDHS
jgi:predicted ATP-grasp superfamily ATP-dependent carboligase